MNPFLTQREEQSLRVYADTALKLALEMDQRARSASNKTLRDIYRKEIRTAVAGFKLYFTRSTPLNLP